MEEMFTNFQHRPPRAVLLVVLGGVVALSIQQLVAPELLPGDVLGPRVGVDAGGEGAQRSLSYSPVEEGADDVEMEDQFHRTLTSMVNDMFGLEDDEILAIPTEDSLNSESNTRASEASSTITSHAQLIDAGQPLPPYTIEDAIESGKLYIRNFGLLVYDPHVDSFYLLYSKRHRWTSGCAKLTKSFKYVVYMMRKLFPERFQGTTSKELIIPFSSGDYPGVKETSLGNFRRDSSDPPHDSAPILHFGSVFRNPRLFPNMIAMPMPVLEHLGAFRAWAGNGVVSNQFRKKLSLGANTGPEWEDLMPQVVWRGTDFDFLTEVQDVLVKPTFRESLINWPWSQNKQDQRNKRIGGHTAYLAAERKRKIERIRKRSPERGEQYAQELARFTKAAAVEALKDEYTHLLPRWQAVVLTAEAEANTEVDGLPWANMKFSNFADSGTKKATIGSDEYKEWEDIGMATGDFMSLSTLSKYKYQIDLGGGGGTTWAGTLEKLALPGLLFHHLTPTKDYIHDWMKPWVHYVPVSSDLLDLKEKFDWAESHPVEAKNIADEGTSLTRYLVSPEGFEKMFQQDIVEPLRRVIEAYQPISTIYPETPLLSWGDAIKKIEGDDMLFPIRKCDGFFMKGECEQLLGSDYMKSHFTLHTTRHIPLGV